MGGAPWSWWIGQEGVRWGRMREWGEWRGQKGVRQFVGSWLVSPWASNILPPVFLLCRVLESPIKLISFNGEESGNLFINLVFTSELN